MRVALLPVGYADGLRRELSGSGWVMIAGRRAAILGRVSMNLTVVDVTAIAGVRAGDEAVVLGAGIKADDHARLAGTIAYEIVCGVHPCG
jgi:alanine racemase